MSSSLGIYIGKNIIKYAKLQKDKDNVKVDSYNIDFYEDGELEEKINKIVSETYSYKEPISFNLSDEIYTSFEISSLLNKQDTKKAIDIDYEMLCNENGFNKKTLDHKYFIVEANKETEKNKAISVLANKNEIAKRTNLFSGKKIGSVTPIATTVTNLAEINGRENIVIVNIEDKTTVTTMINGQVFQIDTIESGMQKILDDINRTENSFSKSYEVCKNITVYAQGSTDMYSNMDDYYETVTTVLQEIANKTKQIVNNMLSNIDRIYISGMGACINNVDLYFQEVIPAIRCELLKPYFVKEASAQVPLKEYIEVNSAIALALNGLGMLNKNLNFAKTTGAAVSSTLNTNVTAGSIKNWIIDLGEKISSDFKSPFSSEEKTIVRGIITCIIAIVLFAGFSNTISDKIKDKKREVDTVLQASQKELSKMNKDITTINDATLAYKTAIDEIKNIENNKDDEVENSSIRIIAKDSIPNLLNRIMFVIPKKVKLTSIKNTTSKHIVIEAEAEKYEQLGYFKAVLTANKILENVKSTSGEKTGTVIKVTIEGDLP